MKDYLLKREADLSEALEQLDAIYSRNWPERKDLAHACTAGMGNLMAHLYEVQAALKFLNGEQPK